MPVTPPMCSICGNPVSGSIDHRYVCYFCTRWNRAFDRARSAAVFDGPAAEAIRQLKYRKHLWLVPDLVELLWSAMRLYYADGAYDAIGFVPLYHARRRNRGFNQSALLAAALSRKSGIPLLRRGLRRIRHTASQTRLKADARRANMNNAFAPTACKWLENRRILLVDDVMTTGATVSACAAALKKGGASRVDVLTLARQAEI